MKTSISILVSILFTTGSLWSSLITEAAANPGPVTEMLQPANPSPRLNIGVSRSRRLKPGHKTDADHADASALAASHEYYVAYTDDNQISRGDFLNGKIAVSGNKGSIFVTSGKTLRLLAGVIVVDNSGSEPVEISSPEKIEIPPSASMQLAMNNRTDQITHEQCPYRALRNGPEPLRLWVQDGAEFGVTKNGILEFMRGEAVIQSSAPIKIKTLAGTIDSTTPILTSVRVLTTGLFVENCLVRNVISLHTHSHAVSLKGGESCILVNCAPSDQATPQDGIERRQQVAAYDGFMTVIKGEFNMVSIIEKFDALYAAYKNPVSPGEKVMMQSWIKSIAALSIVDSGKTDYSQQPKLAGVTKLGHFTLPILAQGADSN